MTPGVPGVVGAEYSATVAMGVMGVRSRYCHRCETRPIYSKFPEGGLCYQCLKREAEADRPEVPEYVEPEYFTICGRQFPDNAGRIDLWEAFGPNPPLEIAESVRFDRNDDIRRDYIAGTRVGVLATVYGLSRQRIGDIIHGRAHHLACHSPQVCCGDPGEFAWGCGGEMMVERARKARRGRLDNMYRRFKFVDRKMPDNWLIGREVRAIRDAMGLSREQLGKMLEVSARAVYYWEAGTNMATGERLDRLHSLKRRVVAGSFTWVPGLYSRALPLAA